MWYTQILHNISKLQIQDLLTVLDLDQLDLDHDLPRQVGGKHFLAGDGSLKSSKTITPPGCPLSYDLPPTPTT